MILAVVSHPNPKTKRTNVQLSTKRIAMCLRIARLQAVVEAFLVALETIICLFALITTSHIFTLKAGS